TLRNPAHMVLSSKGDIWVTDRRLRDIFIFGADGKFKRSFSPTGTAAFDWTPLALALDAKDRLRATDVGQTDKHRIIYFDENGKQTAKFGQTAQVNRYDEQPGSFFFPNGVAISKDGDVFISDGDNRRVQVFDDKGVFQHFVNTSGVPRGIAIDKKERLYVADAISHTIDIYSLKGQRLTQFGSQGFGPGQFNFPNDVTIGPEQRIYITDRENNQVQVWGWPVAEPPKIAMPKKAWQWALCGLPLLLLLLPFLLRKKRLVVTEDFVGAMVEADDVRLMVDRRYRWTTPEETHEVFEGRIEADVDLGKLIEGEPHSESDARVIAERLGGDMETAILLAMAQRSKGLCTEDLELRRLANLLEIDVYDREAYLKHLARQKR
ncbi:MAG: 6-bladed beta-propeller, partial [Actinomycetota bacterium]|nr:6-bladed beta-propeller [Actinomycetota bacterium]